MALLIPLSLTSSAQKLMIYRNDKSFNVLPLSTQPVLEHLQTAEGDISLSIPAGTGSESVAVSAIDSCVVRMIDIPTLSFDFPDYPDATTVWDKETYISALLSVEGCGYVDDMDAAPLSVKGRGNSTWKLDKKPIRLKFDKKTSLCGFKKAKSYVLLADYLDPTHLRNALTFFTAQQLGIPYANHFVPCNVVVNGHNQGLYMLTEKVGINGSSVDIDENEGILLEMSLEYDEPYKFRTIPYNLPAMVKDPDFDELSAADPEGPASAERLSLWKSDFNAALQAIKDGKAFDCFDLDTFVDYMLLVQFANNEEMEGPKSLYIYKRSLAEGEKYCFGPVWDYDIAYDFTTIRDKEWYDVPADTETAMHQFLIDLCEYPEFKAAYDARMEHFISEIYPKVVKFVDEYASLIEPSAKLDGLLWPETITGSWSVRFPSFDHAEKVSHLKNWLDRRIEYLKK